MPRPPLFAPHWAMGEAGHGANDFSGENASFWIVKSRNGDPPPIGYDPRSRNKLLLF
jgi:hypothetical protein